MAGFDKYTAELRVNELYKQIKSITMHFTEEDGCVIEAKLMDGRDIIVSPNNYYYGRDILNALGNLLEIIQSETNNRIRLYDEIDTNHG